ncbi:MAG: MBL fold metallo-hydrolase [Halioglobus sp.]
MKILLIVGLLFVVVGSGVSQSEDLEASDKPSQNASDEFSYYERDRPLFQMNWNSGSEDCSTNDQPPIEVLAFSSSTYVLRQNKCIHFEAPFIYILFGEHTVLVHDTGATGSSKEFPLYKTVSTLINERRQLGYPKTQTILVTHSHSHRDHTSADLQFRNQPNVTLIEPKKEAILNYFGISNWPNQSATIDLGARELKIIPTPGHQEESISIYDPQTQWMLTGDTFYPGIVYVKNWQTYKSSIKRLVDFSKDYQVSLLMGSHIEMTNRDGVAYPIGATYQPDEAALPLQLEDLYQLHAALEESGEKARSMTFGNLIVTPMNVFQKAIGGVLKWLTQ